MYYGRITGGSSGGTLEGQGIARCAVGLVQPVGQLGRVALGNGGRLYTHVQSGIVEKEVDGHKNG